MYICLEYLSQSYNVTETTPSFSQFELFFVLLSCLGVIVFQKLRVFVILLAGRFQLTFMSLEPNVVLQGCTCTDLNAFGCYL
jgi:hypothetical protein